MTFVIEPPDHSFAMLLNDPLPADSLPMLFSVPLPPLPNVLVVPPLVAKVVLPAEVSPADAVSSPFEVIVPPSSILTEPAVAVVDKVARKHGTETVAQAYLEYLYNETGQEIIGKHYYRPRSQAAAQPLRSA